MAPNVLTWSTRKLEGFLTSPEAFLELTAAMVSLAGVIAALQGSSLGRRSLCLVTRSSQRLTFLFDRCH